LKKGNNTVEGKGGRLERTDLFKTKSRQHAEAAEKKHQWLKTKRKENDLLKYDKSAPKTRERNRRSRPREKRREQTNTCGCPRPSPCEGAEAAGDGSGAPLEKKAPKIKEHQEAHKRGRKR